MDRKKRSAGQTCALLGMLLALSLLLSYVETLIPFHFGIPGIKLGLANLVVLVTLYRLGPGDALLVSVARIFLAGFLFGNLASILYSLSGGLLSFLGMLLLKKTGKLGLLAVSVAGGIFHNLGQVLMAAWVVENMNFLYYMSVLFFAGLITGALIGIVAGEILKRLPKTDGRKP